MKAQAGREQRLRRYWNSHAGSYDRQMGFFDRHLFADSREWVCSKATGSILEVAIGTGLNLPHYPAGVQLTGVDHSPAMLQIARQRAGQLGREVDLREGDAQALEFPGAMFDTVVCTFRCARSPTTARPWPRWPGCSAPAGYCCSLTTSRPRRGRPAPRRR